MAVRDRQHELLVDAEKLRKVRLTNYFALMATALVGTYLWANIFTNPNVYSSVASQSHQAFVDDYETYLADNEKHPWCGTGRLDEYEVGFLVDDGKGGHHFMTEGEYEKLIAKGLEEA